jgi:hypothetical protein
LAVDRIGGASANCVGSEMGDDLVTVEVEIDPMARAATFRTAEQLAVETAGRGEIVDRKGKVKRRRGHRIFLSCDPCEGKGKQSTDISGLLRRSLLAMTVPE